MIKFEQNFPGGWKVEVSMSSDSTLSDVIDAFECFLHAAGFNAESVKEEVGKMRAKPEGTKRGRKPKVAKPDISDLSQPFGDDSQHTSEGSQS
jgi:hypothetical protein